MGFEFGSPESKASTLTTKPRPKSRSQQLTDIVQNGIFTSATPTSNEEHINLMECVDEALIILPRYSVPIKRQLTLSRKSRSLNFDKGRVFNHFIKCFIFCFDG